MRTAAIACLAALTLLPALARAEDPKPKDILNLLLGPAHAEPPPLTADEKARFDQASDYSAKYAGHAVLIMRHGQVIYERYDNGWAADRAHPLASGTKSFTGVAAMIAVQEGLISLDEKVADTITEWKTDPLKSQITVRHLLTLSSGLQPDSKPSHDGQPAGAGEKGLGGILERLKADNWFMDAVNAPMTGTPGGQFAYGGNHYYAFGEFFERKLKAKNSLYKTIWDYYIAKIFEPIGMTIGRIGRDNAGHPNLPGGASLTAREWVKFGQLVLQNGAWKHSDGSMKQVVMPDLLSLCFVPSAKNPNYGLTWWLKNSGGKTDAEAIQPPSETPAPAPAKDEKIEDAAKKLLRDTLRDRLLKNQGGGGGGGGQQKNLDQQNEAVLGPDGKPVTVRMAAGLGKQRLIVLPQYDMVIVRFADIAALQTGQGFDDRLFIAPILGFDKDGKPLH